MDGTLLKKIKIKDTEFGKDISIELESREKSLDFLTKYQGLDSKIELEKEKIAIEKVKANIDKEISKKENKLIIEVIDDK